MREFVMYSVMYSYEMDVILLFDQNQYLHNKMKTRSRMERCSYK